MKTALVRLAFLINAHQNANQKPIGSAPAYPRTLPPQPIYQTLFFDLGRVKYRVKATYVIINFGINSTGLPHTLTRS